MNKSDSSEYFCPLPENKSYEFLGGEGVEESARGIILSFCRSVSEVAKKTNSSEEISNLSAMVLRMASANPRTRAQCLLDLNHDADPEKKELAAIMGILLTKGEEFPEAFSEKTQEVLSDLTTCSDREKVILKNFTIRLVLNWLEKMREKQNEINQVDDIISGFEVLTLVESVPSSAVKRTRVGNEDVSRLVDGDQKDESDNRSKKSRVEQVNLR